MSYVIGKRGIHEAFGYTGLQWPICTIGSRDYCHALLGVSSFFFAIENVWEMTTAVDKIACRSCTTCPLPIVLRLFVADTISSATVCSQYVKTLRTRQKHGKFYYHNYGTTARPTKNRLTRLILRQLAKMMFPRASLHSKTLTVHKLKVLQWNHDHHSPTFKF